MTKPITSVAAMILYEEGRLALTNPVSAFIPAFEDVRVYDGGSDQKQVTVPAAEPVRVWHLLTHTAGLTYGFHRVHPVDAAVPGGRFRVGHAARHGPGRRPATSGPASRCCSSRGPNGTTRSPPTSSAASSRWPPASSLDEFFEARILRPLGMTDTAFWAAPQAQPRLAALYRPSPDGHGHPAGRTGPGRAQAAAHAQRGRRPGVHRGRLQPVHPDAAAHGRQPGRRARRHQAAQPAHGRLHGPQPPARAARTWRPSAARSTPSPRSAGSASASASPSSSTRCRAR